MDQDPWLKSQLKTWNTIKIELKLLDKLWIIRWYAYDPDFRPSQLDFRFKIWTGKEASTFYSLTNKGLLKDFQTLKREFSLEQQDFYRYLQLRNYFDKFIKKTSNRCGRRNTKRNPKVVLVWICWRCYLKIVQKSPNKKIVFHELHQK